VALLGYKDHPAIAAQILDVSHHGIGASLRYRAKQLKRELDANPAMIAALHDGMQNAALAIGIAMGPLANDAMAMPAVIYGLLAYAACAVWIPIGRAVARRSDASA
jgi:predicted Na+-dependent transporter